MEIEEHVMEPMPQALNPHNKPKNKLHGKVALITGGDIGIGRAICYSFALEGASIAFTYLKGFKIVDAKDPIAISTDVGYDENCRKVVDEVVNNFGTIDILVNNASERHMANSIKEITADRLQRVFRTNIFSHFFMTRSLKPMYFLFYF
ncbi:reductase [Lithospermum erythrorhizon]|uniref:Reductase n=1 Tax=Lithospermum erythrorhizon TaxID=34254 RepID=A0AAV3QAQ0_LITER